MAQHHRNGSQDPNTKMPEGLSVEFVSRINSLPDTVKSRYLKSELTSKFVSTDTDAPLVRRQRAINKWLSVERDNEATNDRLILTPDSYPLMGQVPYGRFMSFCQSVIIDIIGETAPVEALIGSFSGGASTSRNRTESHPASKYLGKAHVTPRALDVFNSITDEMPGWLGSEGVLNYEIVPGNVLFTVPKKTDIDRVACKEPDINMFVQKGIGNFIRRSLRKANIDLNDQSKNRSLARRGSLEGDLATLDLSSASDTISRELVAQLMPVCWFTLLDSVRSPVTIIDGIEHVNEMFSSMGNGFTFELESLLFYSIARTVCYFTGTRGIVSVYGDDIICPVQVAPALTDVLSYFGFEVNTKKSFWDGPFRESCGGHYHNGFDITPFYLRAPLDTLVDVIDVANKLREWGSSPVDRDRSGRVRAFVIDPDIEDIWCWLASYVPKRFWGGGDTSFKYQLVADTASHSRLVEETRRKSNGIGGYYHWLNATWERTALRDGVVTSSRTESRKKFREKRVRNSSVPQLASVFLHEIYR